MKKFGLLLFCLMIACAPSKETVSVVEGAPGADGSDGKDGKDAISLICNFIEEEAGYYFSCNNEMTGFLRHGVDGLPGQNGNDGVDGQDGEDGEDGQDAIGGDLDSTLYTSSSCTAIGNGYYGKSGSNSYTVYDDNDCHSSDKVLEMNDANSTKNLGNGKIAIYTFPNDLLVIEFNLN